MRVSKRLTRVVEIRDASLALMQSQGRWSKSFGGSGWLVRAASIGALLIHSRIPFTQPPELTDHIHSVAAAPDEQLVERPFGLDVWADNKVLNLEWRNKDEIDVVTFRRGAWEEELLKAAEALKPQFA